jgi:hypothetical protein
MFHHFAGHYNQGDVFSFRFSNCTRPTMEICNPIGFENTKAEKARGGAGEELIYISYEE